MVIMCIQFPVGSLFQLCIIVVHPSSPVELTTIITIQNVVNNLH